MFDVRLRLHGDTGARGRVLKTATLTHTAVDSGTGVLSFAASERVVGSLESPFVCGVEFSTGGAWAAPRSNLFIAFEDDGDGTDQTGTETFTAHEFVPWLMARMYVQGTPADPTGTRQFTDATPGAILLTIMSEAQAFGWGPGVTADFTATHDSNGVAWASADRSSPQYRVTTPMTQVLASLSKLGLVEWWTEGMVLRAVRAGTGTDRSASVVLGGRGFTRAPLKSSFADVFTHLTVILDDGQWLNLPNPGADNRFGTLWSSMSQAGVPAAEAIRLAQPALTGGRAKKRELSYDWVPAGGLPVPWVQFNIGDVVTARTRDGKSPLRVIGTVVSKGEDGVTARAVVGDKLLTHAAKVASRTAAASQGTIIGGVGDAFPSTNGPASPIPKAPTGLVATSNVGEWREDGSAVARVTLDWAAVTQSIDEAAMNVARYEVWSREAAQTSSLTTATIDTEATVEWAPGVTRWVKVRAQSHDGRWSEFSDEIAVTPASPLSIVPKAPTGLEVASNTGSFQADGSVIATLRLQWDAVTLSVEDAPVVVQSYEVWLLADEVWAPYVQTPARDVLVTLPGGVERSVRVRALTTLGVWSDFSDVVPATAAVPGLSDAAPTMPALTSRLSVVYAAWDGLLTTGEPGPGYGTTVAEFGPSSAGPWTRTASPFPVGGGQVPIPGHIDETVWVRFVPVDTLGRVGTASEAASIVVVGVEGADIVANTIEANHVRLGSLTVAHMEDGFGASLDLADNAVIIGVQSQVEATQAQTDETSAALTEVQTWFRVDAEGGHMGRSDSEFQTHIKPDRFEITQNDVPKAWLEAGRLVAPSAELGTAVIGKLQFEPFGSEMVVRFIG